MMYIDLITQILSVFIGVGIAIALGNYFANKFWE